MIALVDSCGKAIRSPLDHAFRLGLATLVLLSGLCGCAGWNTRDEGFKENDLSQSVRKARPQEKEKDINYWSFSEKGRQVERDLHAM